VCLKKVEKAKGATEVDARNEETYQEEVPEGRPTPGEEMMRMMEEDKYDNDDVRQDWNDTSGALFYSLRKKWPTCSACGGPCRLMVETMLRLDKGFHGERKIENAVVQCAGYHYEDVRRDTGTGKPKGVCELRRVTLKENKNSDLKNLRTTPKPRGPFRSSCEYGIEGGSLFLRNGQQAGHDGERRYRKAPESYSDSNY